MPETAPRLRRSVRSRLRRFSWLMLATVVLALASLLASQYWLQRSLAVLENRLLPHWQAAQQLASDAQALSAQAARLPLSATLGALETLEARILTQRTLLDEDLQRIASHAEALPELAALRQAVAQLQPTLEQSSRTARQRIALAAQPDAAADGRQELAALQRSERDLAARLDDQTVILASQASALLGDLERLLRAQRQQLQLLRGLQSLLTLLACLSIATLLLAQIRLLERRLLQPLERLRLDMLRGQVDALPPGAEDAPNDELEAMQLELARLFGRLTQQNLALEQLATTDPLTGLANRRHLLELLDHEMARHRRSNQPLTLLLLDIDHFKTVNDTWGHLAGDRVLRQLGELLRLGLRGADLAARYGGEEFLLLLPETAGEGARHIAEQLRARIAGSPTALEDGRHLDITVSIGLACLQPGDEVASLIDRADTALYRAKHEGRNRVCMAVEAGVSPRPSRAHASAPDCAPPAGQ